MCVNGTHNGPLMDGTPPTGRTLPFRGLPSLRLRGDKIRSEHVYVDRQTVAEQLGLKGK